MKTFFSTINGVLVVFILLFIIENLVKSTIELNFTKAYLNGTFLINSKYDKSIYLGLNDGNMIKSDKKIEYDIYQVYQKGYILISKDLNKLLGTNINKNNNFCFYDKNITYENFDFKLILWNLYNLKENYYLVENQYNNKYIKLNNINFILDNFNCSNQSINNIDDKYKLRILKLYEENNENEIEIIENEPIDVFIKYIDLSDKNLNREGIKQIFKDYDNQELKYSLRGIIEYIPWVRKIFILFPNEKVSFLKPYHEINNKIIYVKDKDILGFDSANIFAFSFNLYKLEKYGISKNFIYMEDDYFIGQPLKKTDFFYYDKKQKRVLPYLLNTYYREINKIEIIDSYTKYLINLNNIKPHSAKGWDFSILSTNKYFFEKYKMENIISPVFTHCAFPENIDDLKEIYIDIQNYKYINETLFSKTRHVLTLNQPHFHNLYLLNIKKRKVHKIPNRYINMETLKEGSTFIPLFVINTCGNDIPTKNDYINAKKIMEKRFPNKTEYELFNYKNTNLQNNINKNNLKYQANYPYLYLFCFTVVLFIKFKILKKNNHSNIFLF